MYNIYICIIYIYTYHNMCIYMCIYMCVYIFFTHRWSRSATVSQQFRNCCGSTHFDNQPVLSKSVGRVPQQFRNSSATVPQQFRNCCGTRPIVCWSVAEQKISIIQANLRDTQRLIEQANQLGLIQRLVDDLSLSAHRSHVTHMNQSTSHTNETCHILGCITACITMGWLRLVGSSKKQVSFAKEPYTRDAILQKRPIILRSLLIVATPHVHTQLDQDVSLCAHRSHVTHMNESTSHIRTSHVTIRMYHYVHTGVMAHI